jgi:hypothetical protein
MPTRSACERRVYRLAALLTGNPVAATSVIEQVVDAQPRLDRLDSDHLDRLTVLRSREIPAAMLVDDAIPQAVAGGVAGLTAQQREVWVFTHVYRMPMRQAARAMDCSRTAATRHLEQAEGAVSREAGVGSAEAGELLLSYSMALDVPAFYRAARVRRRRLRLWLRVAGIVLILAAVVALLRWGPELLRR